MSRWTNRNGRELDDAYAALRQLASEPRLTPEGHRWVAQRLADGLFRPPTDVIAYFGLDPETDWMEEDE